MLIPEYRLKNPEYGLGSFGGGVAIRIPPRRPTSHNDDRASAKHGPVPIRKVSHRGER